MKTVKNKSIQKLPAHSTITHLMHPEILFLGSGLTSCWKSQDFAAFWKARRVGAHWIPGKYFKEQKNNHDKRLIT